MCVVKKIRITNRTTNNFVDTFLFKKKETHVFIQRKKKKKVSENKNKIVLIKFFQRIGFQLHQVSTCTHR